MNKNLLYFGIFLLFLFFLIPLNPISTSRLDSLNFTSDNRVLVLSSRDTFHHSTSHNYAIQNNQSGIKGLFVEATPQAAIVLTLENNLDPGSIYWGRKIKRYYLETNLSEICDLLPHQANALGFDYILAERFSFRYKLDDCFSDVNIDNSSNVPYSIISNFTGYIENQSKLNNSTSFFLFELPETSLVEIPTKRLELLSEEWDDYVYHWFFTPQIKDYIFVSGLQNFSVDGQIKNISYTKDGLSFEVDSDDVVPVLVKISEFPNWRAYQNNTRLEIFRASPYMMLVYAAPGEVVFKYVRDPIDIISIFISIVSFILLVILLFIFPIKREKRNKISSYILLVVLFFAAKFIIPLFQLKNLFRWDLSGHYFSAWFLREYTFPFIFGWNHFFFSGQPFLQFYPPAFAYMSALLSFIFSLDFSIKLIISVSILLVPIVFFFAVKSFSFSEEESVFIVLLMIAIFFFSNGHYGGNYDSIFTIGLIPGFIGLLLFFFFIYLLNAKGNISLLAIFLSLIILTHIVAAISSCIFLVGYMLLSRKRFIVGLKVIAFTFGLTAFWTIPFLWKSKYLYSVMINEFLSSPWLLFLVFLLITIYFFKSKNILFPASFFILVISLFALLDLSFLPIHYYRFNIYILYFLPIFVIYFAKSFFKLLKVKLE
jgi:hypothetical protein